MREGLKVAVVPPQLKGSRWHTVEEATDDGRAGQLVSFADVTTIDGAQGLVGRYVLASREDLPDDFELRNVELLVGRQVTDEGLGLSGTIAEVMVGPANDVWVIDVAGEGELLLPVIDQVVGEVPEKGAIPVNAAGFYQGGAGRGGSRRSPSFRRSLLPTWTPPSWAGPRGPASSTLPRMTCATGPMTATARSTTRPSAAVRACS